MNYTYICPTCLARQGAPAGGKLVSQEIGGCMACRKLEVVFVYKKEAGETQDASGSVPGFAADAPCPRSKRRLQAEPVRNHPRSRQLNLYC